MGSLPGLPQEPERRERDREQARVRSDEGVQERQVSTAGGITAEPPVAAAPPPTADPGRRGRWLANTVFLTPALLLLAVWMFYPLVYTILRSFFGQTGFLGNWVGIDNYKTLFT